MMSSTANREEALHQAAERWKRQLLDVSGRNRLLNYRDLKTGTLDLTPAKGESSAVNVPALESLLAGRRIAMTRLFASEDAQADSRRRLSAIYRRTQEHLDEKGLNTLFVAIGLATWEVSSGSKPNAPVILIPATVSPDGGGRWDFTVELSGDAHVNPVLFHVLRDEYRIDIPDDDDGLTGDLSLTGVKKQLQDLERRWSKVAGIAIADRVVAGNFIYTNMPMVADLDHNLAAFADNDFVAAIAGVNEARQALADRIQDPPLNRPDTDPPENEFLVVDADASQNRAINRVLAGESLVIWGPPGTGKSQTIANLIASLISQGKRVLFVAEKRAAIEVVIARLRRVGLSNLVMDVHGGVRSRREFAGSLADSMRDIGTVPARDDSELHRRLSERRAELIAHVDAMHAIREPWRVSLFEVQEKLIGVPASVANGAVMPAARARQLNREAVARLMRNVREWVDLEGPRLGLRYPEWGRTGIDSSEAAQWAFELARDSAAKLPSVRNQLFAALDQIGLAHPNTVADWLTLLKWLSEVEQLQQRFTLEVYGLNHSDLTTALASADSIWEPALALLPTKYRKARKSVRTTLHDDANLSGSDALQAARAAASQIRKWRELAGDGVYPRAPERLSDTLAALDELNGLLERTSSVFSENLLELPFAQLEELLNRLASQRDIAAKLPRVRELERGFADAGIDDITAKAGDEISSERAAEAVEHCWLQAVWDDLVFNDPNLAGFTGTAHDRREAEFITWDREHLTITPERIKRAAAEAAITAMNEYPREAALLKGEAARQRRHMPVRKLFNETQHVITSVRPCWTMSPLLVAELIPAAANLFDVAIFDEASQIPPAEAIGSLARAPQVVIAGDDRQLPPTDFFSAGGADADDDSIDDTALTDDIESILDVAKAGLVREEMLQWHYRSRDGRLIAFSNAHIYGNGLTAFPGVSLRAPITHHLVPFRPLPQQTPSNPDEVERAVDMIIDHARLSPNESLGVIAFGIRHAHNIDEALRARLRDLKDASLDEFFSEKSEERFFVKNIERVQGDERDVIILSVGYHKAANGTLPYHFGPLNQLGGERRLNVAVTRARSRVHLVSSFSHHDMDPGRSSARGVELLRQYLEFAISGGSELGSEVSKVPLNPFELDVLHRLEDRGIKVVPQYGVSGYRIDFACAHPEQPGRMVLAIEADGAAYHSAHTARERDRLRQQVLEDKGWRFHRIWSTDWFRNPEEEVKRAVEAWRQAVTDADSGNHGTVNGDSLEPLISSVLDLPGRGPRPNVQPGRGAITDYSHTELVALARWINSDTLLRTDEELMAEMRRELGFQRRGSRIDAALQRAIDQV
ncbi:MAG: AAA domain-containing protein [Chloroflexota bacterium]|nr:AAA domain-containing protein [Chloroflexota bacterium]MDE2959283.1 AAA domain-containing protein [Chloroflexota bacterium]